MPRIHRRASFPTPEPSLSSYNMAVKAPAPSKLDLDLLRMVNNAKELNLDLDQLIESDHERSLKVKPLIRAEMSHSQRSAGTVAQYYVKSETPPSEDYFLSLGRMKNASKDRPPPLRSSSVISAGPSWSSSDTDPVMKDSRYPRRGRDGPKPHVHFSDRAPPKLSHHASSNTRYHEDISEAGDETRQGRPEITHSSETRNPSNSSRPRTPRVSKGTELSAVDLKWGVLFNDRGEATKKFEQLCCGIADYIITSYEPRNSLVITTRKLYAFYKTFAGKTELLSFQHMFDCETTQEFKDVLSIYDSLKCDYHLVPFHQGETPHIPALTPSGFTKWMTCCVLAAPDQEAYRLGKVVENLPIESKSNGVTERLPKQLSRHLFPAKADKGMKELLLDICHMDYFTTQRSLIVPSHSGRDYHKHDASRRYIPGEKADEIEIAHRQHSKHRRPEHLQHERSDKYRPSSAEGKPRGYSSPDHRPSNRRRDTSPIRSRHHSSPERRHQYSSLLNPSSAHRRSRDKSPDGEYMYSFGRGESRKSTYENTPRSSGDARRRGLGPTYEEYLREPSRLERGH